MLKAQGKTQAEWNYWEQSTDSLFKTLDSSPGGLRSPEAQARLAQHGPNRIKATSEVTPFGLFFRQFKSPILLILLLATGVSAVVKDWTDAVIILLIVLGSALLSFFQEYNAHNAAQKLKAQIVSKSEVLRDGQTRAIPSEQVVPGDIVVLAAGSLIPADGVVLEAHDFFVNQAVLTGETFPVEKNPGIMPVGTSLALRTNTVFMGTNVRSGSANILVTQTGVLTAFGQIADRLALRPPETEFERGIRHLGYLLSEVMFILVLGIFAVNVLFHKPPLDSLLFSIALAVGLTPQLLPAIINLNLSKGAQAMAASGVIVRRLESIENFGSMDILCTDKTGTLTVGVVQLDGALDTQGNPSPQVMRLAYLNAHFQTGLPNPLDDAIVASGNQDLSGVAKLDEVPYDFVRKRLSLVIQEGPEKELPICMITKGAFENVLSVCDRLQSDGHSLPLTEAEKNGLHQRYEEWSEQGYRVLGLAVKESRQPAPAYHKGDEQGMDFVGFLLFFDPPKPEVSHAIQELAGLGVNIKIITGDNHLVARHAAQAVGLGSGAVLSADQLHDLGDEALWQAVNQTTIFAEVDPNEKERIILALKKTGHVVGYMGDGINDAPALHSADVGVSVENAVDVAKEAADFVLLRSDLEVLRQGILIGRKTFANTLKYVFMATSANFGNMFSMAAASLFLPFLPMLPEQILLINFLTDLPETTIANDNVDQAFVDRPHRWDVGFIRRFMLVFGPISSFFDLLTFSLLLWVLHAGQSEFHTAWFIESVLSAGLVVFALRTRLPFYHSRPNRWMIWVTALVAAVALALPYTPLAGWLGFTPLQPVLLLTIFTIVVIYFLTAEFTKRWFYRRYFI